MALLSYQQAQIGGTVVTFTAAGGSGDTLPADDNGVLMVNNGSGAGITVTVAVPGNTKFGVAQPDVTSVSIGAGAIGVVGPLPADLRDPADNLVHVSYSATTSVTVAAVRV